MSFLIFKTVKYKHVYSDHYIGYRSGLSYSRSHTNTDSLQQQRKEVNRAENAKVLLRAQGTRMSSKDTDDVSQEGLLRLAFGFSCG